MKSPLVTQTIVSYFSVKSKRHEQKNPLLSALQFLLKLEVCELEKRVTLFIDGEEIKF